MFKSVDLKSLLIGGLLTLLITTCFAGLPWLDKDTFGRFKIVTIERGAYLLDTATGQAWTHITPDNTISVSPGFTDPKVDPNAVMPVQ
jgi:hypothetical protein